MRLLKPGEQEPQGQFRRRRTSGEFSAYEQEIILNMAQGAGVAIGQMSGSELATVVERFGNMRANCTDRERHTFPADVVEVFEGMYTVPAYLLFERFEKESGWEPIHRPEE